MAYHHKMAAKKQLSNSNGGGWGSSQNILAKLNVKMFCCNNEWKLTCWGTMNKIIGPKVTVELLRAHGIDHSPWFTKHLLGSLN